MHFDHWTLLVKIGITEILVGCAEKVRSPHTCFPTEIRNC